MPKIHIAQDVYDIILLRKHDGQSTTGFLRELLWKHYPSSHKLIVDPIDNTESSSAKRGKRGK